MKPKRPVETVGLFGEERRLLLEVLGGLDEAGWRADTSCPGWSVKDIAAHILGDDFNNLSGGRDGYRESWFEAPDWEALVDFINARNQAWVDAMRRLSPKVLIEMLDFSGARMREYFEGLDPMATGPNVAWAGEGAMPAWMHIGREYTERWLHQAQVREAVGAPMLYGRAPFQPVLDMFVHALPVAFAGVAAPEGAHVRVDIEGEAGGSWSVVRTDDGWRLFEEVLTLPRTVVGLGQDTAWRLWTRGIEPVAAREAVRIEGDTALGEPVLRAVAIIA